MTHDADVYKTAALLIEEYGDMAVNGAFLKADHLRDAGDLEGHMLWLRIAKATEGLLSDDVPPGTVVN